MTTPLRNDIRTRLYLNDDWRDISTHLRYEQGVTIRRGYGTEDETASPSTCHFTLDNRSGDYTERNPLGTWYGYLGRNTPLELSCRLVKDTASAAASNGWDSTEAHADGAWTVLPWTVLGTTSNYAKAAGKATHALSAAGDIRVSYLATLSQRDIDVAVTVNVPTSNVTGSSVGAGIGVANLVLRGQGALSDYFMLRLVAQTDETYTMDWWAATGGGAAATITGGAAVAVPGLTQASQDIRVRVQVEARTLRAKAWNASGAEPYGWHKTVTVEDDLASTANIRDAAGWVGIRSSLIGGNTNGPITLSYDDFEVFSPEFAGEIASWPQSRDITGNDRTVAITAADITRRLGTGESPLNSALRRLILENPLLGSPVPDGYWPLEDGEFTVADEVQIAAGSGTLGFIPPTAGTTVGHIHWAEDRQLPGASQAPVVTGGGSLVAFLNPVSSPAEWTVAWGQRHSYADGTFLLFATDTSHFQLTLERNPDQLNIIVYLSIDGGAISPILTWTADSKNSLEEWHLFGISADQNGSDVDFYLDVDGATVDSYTETTDTLEGLRRIQLSSVTNASQNTSYSHLVVFSSASSPASSSLYDAFLGHAGERALTRAQRLCRQESIEFDWIGAGINGASVPNTEPMGAQRPVSLLALLQECAKVDNGFLYTQRTISGFQFRTLSTMYSRTNWCDLSQSDGHISPPLSRTNDDQALRNDIRANREGGGSYRHQLDDGSRMSVSDPADGGAGRYDTGVTVNVESDTQLPAQAEWRVHLGTADEDRYPGVRLELARAVYRDTAGLALSAKLRDLDIGDQVGLTGMQSDDIYDDSNQIAVGILKRFDQVTYDMTLTCRPASRYRVFTLDTSYLDDADTTLNEALDTTETGVDVAIAAAGRIWSAADQPYDLVTGGERMTLTALSGATSPQTFTVTRSVNGVVKSHSSGQPIRLAEPDYLGK